MANTTSPSVTVKSDLYTHTKCKKRTVHCNPLIYVHVELHDCCMVNLSFAHPDILGWLDGIRSLFSCVLIVLQPPAFATSVIRVEVDCSVAQSWCELDAIKIKGKRPFQV